MQEIGLLGTAKKQKIAYHAGVNEGIFEIGISIQQLLAQECGVLDLFECDCVHGVIGGKVWNREGMQGG
jgi:hypothetical protein